MGIHAHRGGALLVLAGCALLACTPAMAQVYKCVDRAGRTTYQQAPCGEAQKGGRLAIVPANGGAQTDDATEAEWGARAKRKEVIPGMPRAFVVQAFGTPEEMRPGRAWENAVEVWRYKRKDLETAIGFNKGVVAWKNDNLQDLPAAPPPREDIASKRQNLPVDRPCKELAAELGAPASVDKTADDTLGREVERHTWLPEAGDRERTVVVCVEGKIARVERVPE